MIGCDIRNFCALSLYDIDMTDTVLHDTDAEVRYGDLQNAAQKNHGRIFRLGDIAGEEAPRGLFVLSFLYLLLPTIAVLFQFQSWRIGLPVLAAAAGAAFWLIRYWRASQNAANWAAWRTWPFLLLAALAAWMIGVVPPFAQNMDWLKHYAVFNAMVDQSWPPIIPTEIGFGTLRYSLSYYIVPSLIAKFAGLSVLGVAIWLWTTAGLYLALTLAFGARAIEVSACFFLACLFLFFSGADVIGEGISQAPLVAPLHYEWWAKIGQFSSNMTSILWTPQHALSAWIATFLILRYPVRAVQSGGVLGAAVAVWSPFSAVGIIPVMAWAVWRAGPRHVFSWMNLIIAPILLIAGSIFLINGAAGIPATFVWNHRSFSLRLWIGFVVLEFGAIAASLMLVTPRDAVLIAGSTLTLLLLSVSNVGAYSDLMMRGSLPALAILAALAAVAVVTAPNTWRKAALILCLAVGLVTPAGEILRGLTTPRFTHPAQLRLSDIVADSDTGLAPQYLVLGYKGKVIRTPAASLATLKFTHEGDAVFDDTRHRIVAVDFSDAALVTQPFRLPPGQYEIDVLVDLDVTVARGHYHAGHISVQGQRPMRQFGDVRFSNRKLLLYFVSTGEPMALSFGFGDEAKGKGFMELKRFDISRISYP